MNKAISKGLYLVFLKFCNTFVSLPTFSKVFTNPGTCGPDLLTGFVSGTRQPLGAVSKCVTVHLSMP